MPDTTDKNWPVTDRLLILTPDRDRTPGDWRGAFKPEAERFLRVHPGARHVQIDIAQSRDGQREQIANAIQAHAPLRLLAIACHGWRAGIQLGYHLAEVPALAAVLAQAAGPGGLAVALYACSTAQDDPRAGEGIGTAGTAGEGGFADRLRDELAGHGLVVTVDAHDRRGHCCSNPYVIRMEGQAGAGGAWLVNPARPELFKGWSRRLKDRAADDLRFRYPLLTREQIEAELA